MFTGRRLFSGVLTLTERRLYLCTVNRFDCRVRYRCSLMRTARTRTFFADDSVYYVINNNSGYEGDLEVALVTTGFATEILGEILDNNGVLVEKNDAELSQFALMFEFSGNKHKIRHVLYCCTANRPATKGQTKEDSTEVKTETLSLMASALPTGLVKAKTCESTDETTYNN